MGDAGKVVLDSTRLQQIVILGEAVLAAFLLGWLNTSSVRGFFRSGGQVPPG